VRWDDVNARARGLATHFVSRLALEHLAEAPDLTGFVHRMLGAGLLLETEGAVAASADEVDRAIGRLAATRLTLLGRWLGPGRRRALAVIYERLDLENLRRLLRGLVQGASAGARLRGTVPTPDLPEPALLRLARAGSLADLAQGLRRLGHPAGRALAREAEPRDRQALLRLELALIRLCATRSTRLSRRGGSLLRLHVALSIDLWNAWALLEREHWGDAVRVEEAWLPGGRAIDEPAFRALAVVANSSQRRERIARLLGATPVGELLSDTTLEPAELEARALAVRIKHLRAIARREPLGAGPTLLTLLRIEAEARDLRSLLWGVVFRAPREWLVSRLVAA